MNERSLFLPMNGVNNDWLPVEGEAHQSWPRKRQTNKTRKTAIERGKMHDYT